MHTIALFQFAAAKTREIAIQEGICRHFKQGMVESARMKAIQRDPIFLLMAGLLT
jgi:hypothetical protein